jgi:sn-glycerol 3-phosphate transport system ATP-binding protein
MSEQILKIGLTPASDAGHISLSGVTKSFATATALEGIDVQLGAGQFSVLLGPSGCGKSTLLRLIAGLDHPTAGEIRLGSERIDQLPPKARNLSMVFQSYALFPHLDVAENILFGLSVRRVAKAERQERLLRVAGMMGLSELLARKPSELSGGQQQRVALARAVISERPVCLMDEPLSNLDAKLRAEMRSEIRTLQQRLGLTMVYVTHDQVEAMTMADRIVVMNAGRVEQVATPRELYGRPETVFVAAFIGTPPMNLVPAADLPQVQAPGATATIGIRPEEIILETGENAVSLTARVLSVEYLGADQLVALSVGAGRLLMRYPGQAPILSAELTIALPRSALHFFDASGRRQPSPSDDISTHPQQETTDELFSKDASIGNRRTGVDGAGRMGS